MPSYSRQSSHESGVLEQPSSQLLEDNKCNDLVGLSRVSSVSMVRGLPIETPEKVEVTVAAWGRLRRSTGHSGLRWSAWPRC